MSIFGTPDTIRTCDLQSRSLSLYPALWLSLCGCAAQLCHNNDSLSRKMHCYSLFSGFLLYHTQIHNTTSDKQIFLLNFAVFTNLCVFCTLNSVPAKPCNSTTLKHLQNKKFQTFQRKTNISQSTCKQLSCVPLPILWATRSKIGLTRAQNNSTQHQKCCALFFSLPIPVPSKRQVFKKLLYNKDTKREEHKTSSKQNSGRDLPRETENYYDYQSQRRGNPDD